MLGGSGAAAGRNAVVAIAYASSPQLCWKGMRRRVAMKAWRCDVSASCNHCNCALCRAAVVPYGEPTCNLGRVAKPIKRIARISIRPLSVFK